MPSISLTFALSQLLLSAGVYRFADRYDASSPLLAATSILLLGIVLLVIVDHLIELFILEVLLVAAYFAWLHVGQDHSDTA